MKRTMDFDDAPSKKDMDLSDIVDERMEILVKEGANNLMNLEWVKPEFPPFYDEKKFHLGQRAFYNNCFSMMIAKLCGLLALLAIPSIKNVIMFTKQSGTTCSAFRRYASTILHTWEWYKRKPGLEHQFLESLKIVRKKHCVAFRRSFEKGLVKVSQLDMALAQFGFVGFILLCGDTLGVYTTSEELEGLVHVWRVIGSMLGMDDRYNICSGTVEETRALCRRLLDNAFLPSLANEDKDFDKMSRILIESLWPINPHLNTDTFVAFARDLASSAATNNNHSIKIDTTNMTLYSRFLLNLQHFVLKYLLATNYWWSTFFRAFFNGQMRLALFLTEHFPFLAYWSFGVRNSYVDIYKYHVD